MQAAVNDGARLELARSHLRRCRLCEHLCEVDRQLGERGTCKAGREARVFRHRVECGEELQLIPSHLFYLSGCDLRCQFCIAESAAFNPAIGSELTAGFFRQALAWGRARGAINVQWVGGEPTVHLPAILDVMSVVDDLPPVIWKSDFYGTVEAFELLRGIVDVYVADFKFGNNHCAQRIAGVSGYVEILTRNLKIAASQGDLIVRHLLLPGHGECCFQPVVRWMADHLPRVKFSLRGGYRPRWQAHRDRDLGRSLRRHELTRAFQFVRDCELHLVE